MSYIHLQSTFFRYSPKWFPLRDFIHFISKDERKVTKITASSEINTAAIRAASEFPVFEDLFPFSFHVICYYSAYLFFFFIRRWTQGIYLDKSRRKKVFVPQYVKIRSLKTMLLLLLLRKINNMFKKLVFYWLINIILPSLKLFAYWYLLLNCSNKSNKTIYVFLTYLFSFYTYLLLFMHLK